MLRKKELDWFYQEGASRIYPDAWEKYLEVIPEEERGDLLRSYHKRLISEDKEVQLQAAKAWSTWEGTTSCLLPDLKKIEQSGGDEFATAFARIECHYFLNGGFFESENWIIENVDKIRHIPCEIVQGRYDVVCPAESAWELHKAWPESKLHIIQDAGHAVSEPGIRSKLIEIMQGFEAI